jgi:hypothetical protein
VFASAFQESRGDQFVLSPCRWHSLDKELDVTGEVLVTVLGEVDGEVSPAAVDLAMCLCEFVFANFGADVPITQLARNGLSLGVDVRRITAQVRAIDTVLLGLPAFTTHCSFGGVGFNAEPS